MWLSNIYITNKTQTIVWALLLCFNLAFTQTTTIKSFDGLKNSEGGGFYKHDNKLFFFVGIGTYNPTNTGPYFNVHAQINSNIDTLSTRVYTSAINPTGYAAFYPIIKNNLIFNIGGSPNYSSQSLGYMCFAIHKTYNINNLGIGKGYYSKSLLLLLNRHCITQDSGLISSGGIRLTNTFYKVPIMKRNYNLDTVFYKIYDNSYNLYNGESAQDIKELPNKDILVTGVTDSVDTADMFLLLTDSMGNIKQSKSIGTNGEEGDCKIITIDNKLYMFGTTTGFAGNNKNHILLCKIDAYGNVGKSFIIGDTTSFRVNVRESKKHTLMVIGWTYVAGVKGEHAIYMEIDTNGVVLKYHKANYNTQYVTGGTGRYTSSFTDAVQDSSNNILLALDRYNNTGGFSGYFYTSIVKLDSNLNGCIPSVVATYTTQNVTGQIHSVPLGFHVYRDSLFEATGTVNQTHGFSGIINECSGYVGIKEQSIGNDVVQIYPNPANESLTLTLSEGEGTELSLTDVLGKELNKYKMTSDSITISLSEFNVGVYFMEVKTNNGVVRKKFVKE